MRQTGERFVPLLLEASSTEPGVLMLPPRPPRRGCRLAIGLGQPVLFIRAADASSGDVLPALFPSRSTCGGMGVGQLGGQDGWVLREHKRAAHWLQGPRARKVQRAVRLAAREYTSSSECMQPEKRLYVILVCWHATL